jgi:transposase InsO family protein
VSRFQFVADHRNTFEVKWLCAIVEVARSSFYAWLAGADGRAARATADEVLRARIQTVHDGDNTYGAPRITAELNDGVEDGDRVNHKRVARVMRTAGIAGYRRRRRVKTTSPDPANPKVPDLLSRDFTAPAPNLKYVGDITYLPLSTGTNLYLATVIDCCSRRVAGWAIADHMRTELVADALKAADAMRGTLSGVVFHADHGVNTPQWISRNSAMTWASPNPWAALGQVPITRWPSRSTPPSSAKSSRTVAAGPMRPPAAARSSVGWSATTPNGATPAAGMSAPPPMKGP